MGQICPVARLLLGTIAIFIISQLTMLISLKAYNHIPNVNIYETTTKIKFKWKDIL
jgi:hypothetical protein